jgi:DHA1 family tetracycline resistance protein-like MFS transporter
MFDRKIVSLLLVVFVDLLGFGIVIPILPILVEKTGGGAFMVGVIIASFSLFQFLFSPILGRLSDKYGRKPVLIITSFINAISYFVIFFSQNLWIILLARVIAGIGSANLSVAQAYIADTSASHERTKRMALMGSIFGLGFIFGPLIGGFTSESFSLGTTFLIPAVLSLINSFMIFFLLPESNRSLKKDIKIEFLNLKVTKEIMKPKNMFFLIFLFFFINLSLALIIGVFPIYAHNKFGWTESQNGFYFGLIGVGSFVTQAFLIRFLLKRFDEIAMIKIALIAFGVAVVTVGLTPSGFFALLVGPLMAFGISLANVNVQSLISLESKPEEQGIVLGVSQAFGSMARVVGPLIGGTLSTINLSSPYIVSGIMAFLIFYFGKNYLKLVRARRK